ncbi:MAG: GtrA family protein [Rikenellaceae bacterium]
MTLSSRISHILSKLIDALYFKWLEKFIPRHTFRYGVCGVVNSIVLDTFFYYVIYHYIVAVQPTDLGFIVISAHIMSLILVFPITFLIGFYLNRNVAFHATEEPQERQISKYALSVCGSILLSYLSLKLLIEVCGIWATPAKTISSVLVALYSYLAARFFTFRER